MVRFPEEMKVNIIWHKYINSLLYKMISANNYWQVQLFYHHSVTIDTFLSLSLLFVIYCVKKSNYKQIKTQFLNWRKQFVFHKSFDVLFRMFLFIIDLVEYLISCVGTYPTTLCSIHCAYNDENWVWFIFCFVFVFVMRSEN